MAYQEPCKNAFHPGAKAYNLRIYTNAQVHMLVFVHQHKALFKVGPSRMRIKRHLPGQTYRRIGVSAFAKSRQLRGRDFLVKIAMSKRSLIPPGRRYAETPTPPKSLRIVCYASRIPSRPQADPLCGSQAKASELHRFPYNSIAKAESSKSSFLPKFE